MHAARISDPAKYSRIVTKDLGDGVQLLIGYFEQDGKETSEPQSYHFDKNKFKPKDVKKYLKEHDLKPIELEFANKDNSDEEPKANASGPETTDNNNLGTNDNTELKENSLISHKGEVYPETVPIDRVPDKAFGNIRQGDIPELINRMYEAEPTSIEVIEDVDNENPDFEVELEPESNELSEDKSSKISWDSNISRQEFLDWATDEDGYVAKRPLMKWFLDVDAGDGQSESNYRYPVGAMKDGNPHYCPVALDHSWNLAAGKETGLANRNIQKKIVFLKNREGFPLTEDQLDFTERHMSADPVKYHTFENSNAPGGVEFVPETELKLNSSPAGSKIIYEDDKVIDVPVVPMREGVFTGTDGVPTLKKFEYFGKDAHWLEGQPILKGHTGPTELVTYKHNRIGKLMNVIARPDKKDVVAVARYYKEKLTPEDLTRIKSGTPYDGSIAYTTHTSFVDGQHNGTKYNAVEDSGYHFYHFAELANGTGACSTKDGCGFMLNEDKESNTVEMHLNENYWTAPVRSHLQVLNEQLKNLEKQFKESKLPSLEVDITKLKDDISRWQKQLTNLNPSQNSSPGVNTIQSYYNKLRRADIEFNGSGYSIKLNSRTGSGILETTDKEQSELWAKTYVKSGKIPASMKLNYRCKAEEQQGEGPGSCGGSTGKKETSPKGQLKSAMDKDFKQGFDKIMDKKFGKPSDSKSVSNYNNVRNFGSPKSNPISGSRELTTYNQGTKMYLGIHVPESSKITNSYAPSGAKNTWNFQVPGDPTSYSRVEDAIKVEAVKNFIKDNPKKAEELGYENNIDSDVNNKWPKEVEIEAIKTLPKEYQDMILKPRSKQNSQFLNNSGNNMTNEEFIEPEAVASDETVQKLNESFEAKLNERDNKISELESQLSDLVQKQNAAEEAIVAERAAADFQSFSLKLNAKARQDAQTHYDGFKSEGWAYFDNKNLLTVELPKMNARGVSAGEGDNASGLQAARDMFKKSQKERFSKRA